MATVRKIKRELTQRGIKYPPKALKAELEALLGQEVFANGSTVITAYDTSTYANFIPKKKRTDRPGILNHDADFVDPNSDPGTQA